MKKVLITGGAGYVGSHAAKAFSENGYKVVVLDNLIYGHKGFVKWGEFVEGDIGDTSLLESLFLKYKFDMVSHFAAFAYVGESVQNPGKYYENNMAKALKLLIYALKNNVKVFQFSSTCATYGHPLHIPITESHPQRPFSPYGKSKLFFEEILHDFSNVYDIRHSILRYFNAAGADPEGEIGEDHSPETHLIPLVLDVASGRKPEIEIFGTDYDTDDGTCIRDYIHVTDLAAAHVLAAEKTFHSDSTVYNLGNGDGFSVREVIGKVREVTGKDIRIIEGERRPGDPAKLIGSSDKIIEELGWEPKYASLDKIIETAWQWHQKRF
jgi:UDP-glucose 4-epimerase